MAFIRDIRRQNFSDSDKEFFIEVVRNYMNIVECKKTDYATCRLKENAWRRIHQDFIAACPHIKDCHPKKLQILWKNLKARAKQDFAAFNLAKSRGGSPLPPMKEISHRISEMLLPHFLGLANDFDSDAVRSNIHIGNETTINSDSDNKGPAKVQKRKHPESLNQLKVRVYNEELRMRKIEHDWQREMYELKREKLKLKIQILKKQC